MQLCAQNDLLYKILYDFLYEILYISHIKVDKDAPISNLEF